MRKIILLVAVLLAIGSAWAAYTKEVLVLTTATLIPRTFDTKGVEILNLGPNTIWCAMFDSALAIANKSRSIVTNEVWAVEVKDNVPIYCLSSANQVTGAATIVTEAAR